MAMKQWAWLLAFTGSGCLSSPDTEPTATADEAPIRSEGPDFKSALKTRFDFDPGQQALVVHLDIAPGFHAYTVGESTGRPLQVSVPQDGPFTLGNVQYPKGIAKNLPIGPSVIVEGKAKIVAPVASKAAVDTKAPPRAKGTLHYQICTDEACDRPRKLAFDVETPAPSR